WAGNYQRIVIHENDLHFPFATTPKTLEPDVSGDKRFASGITARRQQSAPKFSNLLHQRQVNLVGPGPIARHRKRGVDIILVTLVADFRRSIDTQHFFEQLVGKALRVRLCVRHSEAFGEITLWPFARKIERDLV